ncbi:hypothetical protein [Pseudomonas sp. LB3P38]|uniref:hypothetical protein n=1 Tax=Pseudomonas lyxosi TaxID=3398358 RepID=UPI0039EFB9C3
MSIVNQNPAVRTYTVSSVVDATVSDRVSFKYHNTKYVAYPESTLIRLTTYSNRHDNTKESHRNFNLKFDKNIQSGTYYVTDYNFPFTEVDYVEATNLTADYLYRPKSGKFTVETIKNSDDKLHYKIHFNFIGVNDYSKEELEIKGTSEFIVLFRP